MYKLNEQTTYIPNVEMYSEINSAMLFLKHSTRNKQNIAQVINLQVPTYPVHKKDVGVDFFYLVIFIVIGIKKYKNAIINVYL